MALAPRSRHLCASRIINRPLEFARSDRLNQPFADCLDARQLPGPEIALTTNSNPHFVGCLQHPQTGLIKPDLRSRLQTGLANRIHADPNRLNLRRVFDSHMSTLSSVHQNIRDFLTILDQYRHMVPGDVWFALYLSWIFGAILFIVMQRRTPSATLAWTIGFLSLPFIGAAVYFFFGPRKLNRRRMRRALARDLAARLSPAVKEEMPPRLLDRQSLSSLARVGSSQGDAPPRASLGVRLFDGGDDTYAAIEAAMRAANHQIHIEYYIFEPDVIGTRWRDLLAERARAGISVRLLVDALGSKSCSAAFFKPLTDAGAQVRLFNPALLMKLRPGMLNFRTHRKIVVVDGKQAFTGGINVSAGNSGSSSGGTAWRDTHMEVLGAPALDLQVVFLEDWLYAGMGHEKHQRRDQHLIETPSDIAGWFPEPTPGDGPWVQIVDSGPDEAIADIHRFFFSAINLARRRLWITTPYFVPDEPILTALVTARARGVDVRIIVPKMGDSKLVTAAASTFADEVIEEGVAVYEFQPCMIHAKTMVIDDELSIIGTANIDNRSFRLNFEVVAAVYDRAIAAELAAMFERDQALSSLVRPEHRSGGYIPRLLANGARLFAPLL